MLNVNELKNNLNVGDYGEDITNYNGNSYICDVISEIADNNTSIYYSDIKNFISDNVEYVENAIDEFGWDGCGSDLMKAGQMGEYLKIQDDIYTNLDDVILYYAYYYLSDVLDIKEITEETNNDIIDTCSDIDTNDRIETIEETIKNLFEEDEQ